MNAMSHNTPSRAARASRTDLRRLARRQVMTLCVQFLVGMAVALIGPSPETTGAAHTASNVLFGLHVVVAIALAAVAVRTVRAARSSGEGVLRLARGGAAMIGLTFAAGVITVITNNDWWSYAMAVGFIASLLVYGSLLVHEQQQVQPE
jgi:heme A synthase